MATRTRRLVAALVVFLCGAGTASAQALSLEFRNGRVRLVAENVPVSRILAEWARLGSTRIVNGERVPGAPVTLQLQDVPERQALDIVLRGAAGYMVAARERSAPGASVFDRILVLPTTARAPSAAALAPPSPPPASQFLDRVEASEVDEPEDAAPPGLPPGIPRGRVRSGLNLPGGAQQQSEVDDETPEQDAPPVATPGNPFGVTPGTARPGAIAPIAPQRSPNNDRQQAR